MTLIVDEIQSEGGFTATTIYTDTIVTTSGADFTDVSGNTLTLKTIPTNNNVLTQILSRNDSTGIIEYRDAGTIGSATPGGVSGEVQFNNGGTFSGASNVEISGGNLQLVGTTDPATPSSNNLILYAKNISGRILPKVIGPSGLSYPLQSALWQNAVYLWSTSSVTNGLWINTVGAGSGTYTAVNPTTTNLYTVQKRSRYNNTVTANGIVGQRNTDAIFFRGSISNQGGFFFYTRCGFDVWTNGGRFFAGFATGTGVVTANPSLLNNTVGFCVDSGDNGAISFLTRNATTATKQPTGLTITTNKGYDIFIFCKPNDTQISYRIIDLITGTEYSNTATLTLPVNTTLLTANVLASNAALNTANLIQLGVSKIYIETDY